jgi:phenylalanyl-tRNA synthetase alpha chain
MFHQLEALVVDEGISMADLKGTMEAVWNRFFGADVKVRLRPGYFPFVEPGCEYDLSCRMCDAAGCRTCKGSGWLELGGAGMVHPAVLEAVGIDPERYTGFAFGLGIDRIAMMRYGIDDLRLLVGNDVRFLRQF